MKRELIYMDAKSSKFWNIELEGSGHTVSYGRIGSGGQQATKSFPSPDAARKDFDKLVKEKLGKGYVEAAAAETASSDQIPLVAFASITHQDEIYKNCGTFIGKRVVDFDPEKGARSDVAYRFRSTYDDDVMLPNLKAFLATPAALETTALVIGNWGGDDSQGSPEAVIEKLVEGRARLPRLAALYLGDITSEECEMSWIHQSDVSPLLEAFPTLQLLRLRGGEDLVIAKPSHTALRALAIESGGLDGSVVRALAASDFPRLEWLELWLGTDDYGGNTTVDDLQPILSGTLFPQLKYLGLRNSDNADKFALALVGSEIVKRIETLDLSLGMLGDEGAEALCALKSPSLKKLNLHYNFIGPELLKKLKALPFNVDVSRPSDLAIDEPYVAVGE